MADTSPITDETLRMSALHAIFPGMQISLMPARESALRPGRTNWIFPTLWQKRTFIALSANQQMKLKRMLPASL
jgi:hypothetical protein